MIVLNFADGVMSALHKNTEGTARTNDPASEVKHDYSKNEKNAPPELELLNIIRFQL